MIRVDLPCEPPVEYDAAYVTVRRGALVISDSNGDMLAAFADGAWYSMRVVDGAPPKEPV